MKKGKKSDVLKLDVYLVKPSHFEEPRYFFSPPLHCWDVSCPRLSIVGISPAVARLPGYLGPAVPLNGKRNDGLPKVFTSQFLKTVNMRTVPGKENEGGGCN